MFTLRIYEDNENIFKNLDDAIKYMYKTKFERDICIYDINDDKARKKIQKLYEAIKEYNKGKPIDNQILPTMPIPYRGILGCLGVQVYEIGLGTYKRHHTIIPMFSSWNTDVLDTSLEEPCIRPSLKAITSLMMFGSMM